MPFPNLPEISTSMPNWLGSQVGHQLELVSWSSNWALAPTLVAPLHLDVVLAAWRSKALHLVEVQEEVQEAGA